MRRRLEVRRGTGLESEFGDSCFFVCPSAKSSTWHRVVSSKITGPQIETQGRPPASRHDWRRRELCQVEWMTSMCVGWKLKAIRIAHRKGQCVSPSSAEKEEGGRARVSAVGAA